MSSVKRLLVITHVSHYRHEGEIFAYGPYVREMNVWCDLFPEVVIAAPCHDGPAPGDGLAFSRENLTVHAIPKSGGEKLSAKLAQLFLLPWIVVRLCMAMWKADAIHVRCPGNLGLLGVILGPLFSSKLIAKYAGQWNGFPGEQWSVGLQRRLLGSRWWRGIVTVYGEWPDQPEHVVSFFTSVMTPQQISRAKEIASTPRPDSPFSIVFVGRLSREKNVDVLIKSVAELSAQGLDIHCSIVGHGAEYDTLNALSRDLGIEKQIHFAGGVDFDEVFDFYSRSHALVLASETEGWPKVIAEAMACGVVCVGSNRGLVPWMLSSGRGFTVEPGDVDDLVRVLSKVATSPQLLHRVSDHAADFGQRYSLETLRDSIADLLSTRWGTPIGPTRSPDVQEDQETQAHTSLDRGDLSSRVSDEVILP